MDPKDLEEAYRSALRAERAAWQAMQVQTVSNQGSDRQRMERWEEASRRVQAARQAFLGDRVGLEGSVPAPVRLGRPLRRLQEELSQAVEAQRKAWAAWQQSERTNNPDPLLQETWLQAVERAKAIRDEVLKARRS